MLKAGLLMGASRERGSALNRSAKLRQQLSNFCGLGKQISELLVSLLKNW